MGRDMMGKRWEGKGIKNGVKIVTAQHTTPHSVGAIKLVLFAGKKDI